MCTSKVHKNSVQSTVMCVAHVLTGGTNQEVEEKILQKGGEQEREAGRAKWW